MADSITPMARPEGEWLGLVKNMRRHTRLPVMHAGRIIRLKWPRALWQKALDVVCMTKAHIADPHFAIKVFENRLSEIRYCTRCLQSCHGNIPLMTCVYNPLTSREATWSKLQHTSVRRRVVVVGAGPAGMEAAITASARGHEVIVLERESRVGGQVWLGASSPLRRNWARIADFYDAQSSRGEFEVRLNTAASAELIARLSPDVVLIATGSKSIAATIRGPVPVYTVERALRGEIDLCRRVVIFDREGFNRPLVVADYLSSRRISVGFVTSFLRVSPLAEEMTLDEMLQEFGKREVKFYPGHAVVCSRENSVSIRSVQTGDEQRIDADAIVAAVGAAPVAELAEELRAVVKTVHVIGDANVPQTLEHATYQGARIGRMI